LKANYENSQSNITVRNLELGQINTKSSNNLELQPEQTFQDLITPNIGENLQSSGEVTTPL
jgi:hypothetical protein